MISLHPSLFQLLKDRQFLLVTAESCTGGSLANAITSLPGSSEWFDRGFITYSNLSKQELLSVPEEILNLFGAVSEQTALVMAEGALKHSVGHLAISVTGIAGPDGGTPEKPVGTVWFGFASFGIFPSFAKMQHFKGDRLAIREQAVDFALETLHRHLLNS